MTTAHQTSLSSSSFLAHLMPRVLRPHERDRDPQQRDPAPGGRLRGGEGPRRGLDVSPRGRSRRRICSSSCTCRPGEQSPRRQRVLLEVDGAQPSLGLRYRQPQRHGQPRQRRVKSETRRRAARSHDDGDDELDEVEQGGQPGHGPDPGGPPAAGSDAAERRGGRPGGREAEVVELAVRGGGV